MNYLTQHLLEALEINSHRKPLYAKLSNNKSKRASNLLISAERLSILSSFPLDNIAKYWQRRNVPVMVHEFISMSETPDFKETFDDDSGIYSTLPAFNTKLLQKDIMKVFKQKDYQKLAQFVDDKITETNEFPKHFCMVRHILESIRRSANLTPMHIKRAHELNVRSPELFCRYVLWLHIVSVHSSSLIDRWAFPVQKEGIPLIYQDVPYIPAMPENY
jgi:hypothetical protein